ncbi:hypothetical protein ACH3XW_42135 [Acanthocheilonema viteae]
MQRISQNDLLSYCLKFSLISRTCHLNALQTVYQQERTIKLYSFREPNAKNSRTKSSKLPTICITLNGDQLRNVKIVEQHKFE